ncbi:MAG: metallophosphoesterase [Alphaproteobacteria bacterium]|nr:metallophosphoesterase [Alphaproteobacteria bacterium]
MHGAPHTVVISDVHLTTAVEPDPKRPLWKRFQQRDLFCDPDLVAMLRHARADAREAGRTLELVLDGDIFDFDAATRLPDDDRFKVGWLERLRGLNPTEEKSAWKLERILDEHPEVVLALQELLDDGDRLVFVVGNHDLDLHWPAVQAVLHRRLDPEGTRDLRVCAWFYLSNGDTLIEHGHQYDTYCLCQDPVSPVIRTRPQGPGRIRLPFGNYASRYMSNGMGLFNPHADKAFVMPFWGYVDFFYRHVARTQPLLVWTWIWTSAATFVASLRDGLLPAERDVVGLEDRVEEIARTSQATPRVVRALDALRAHPAIFHPWKVYRELWLDRLTLVLLVIVGSFQLLATINVLVGVSLAWWFLVFGALLVPFIFYAKQVRSDVDNLEGELRRRLPLLQRVTGVRRLVLGHTHVPRHDVLGGMEVLNAGTWAPAYRDVACTEPVWRRHVVRIRPTSTAGRRATLEAWTGDHFDVVSSGSPGGPARTPSVVAAK